MVQSQRYQQLVVTQHVQVFPGPIEGVPTCAEEGLVEGDVCGEGSVCDLEDDCNRQLICSSDYSADECPVSKAKYKEKYRIH